MTTGEAGAGLETTGGFAADGDGTAVAGGVGDGCCCLAIAVGDGAATVAVVVVVGVMDGLAVGAIESVALVRTGAGTPSSFFSV